MDNLVADIRYAWRMLHHNRGFTAIAVSALALGIGANSAIFTVVNAVLLQPLAYPHPDRIMRLGRKYPNGTGDSNSIPKYMVWRQNHVFESMALYDGTGLGASLGADDRAEPVATAHVSREYFKVFGVPPLKGRTFTETEDLPNGPLVAILSYHVWQSRLGGDPAAIGRVIKLNGEPRTVVGIMPRTFRSDPDAPDTDVWIPLEADPNSTNQGHYLRVAARLKPGVSRAAAEAEMRVVGEQFRKAFPKWMDPNESVAVIPMRDAVVRDVRTALYVLAGAVGFVLLIACANVANLLLARAAGRQREMAVRAAIGANRGQVFRQLLTESILLAGLGGVVGFALGAWGVRVLLALVPGNIPRLTDLNGMRVSLPAVDWRVAAFTIGLALLTGVLFGLFPALHVSNPDLCSALKEGGGRSGTGLRHGRARAALVVAEVALALVLLTGAALLIRTFVGLRTVNPGFDAHNVLTMQTSMAGGTYSTTAKVDHFVTQVARRIESLPAVEAAASAVTLPVTNEIDLPFSIAGKPSAKGEYNGDEQWRFVSPHYFTVFRIPLLRGRTFSETDSEHSAHIVIINDAMARKYWPKEDPVGHVITIGKGLGPQFDDPPREIVGVVGSVRETGLSEAEVGVMYIPQSQVPEGLTTLANSVIPLSWAVRTRLDPMSLRVAVEREFHALDGLLPVARERPMEQVVAQSVARQSFTMLLLNLFAAIAVLLAAIGIYGLMSYSVEQRTQEIGIRMALGAGRPHMVKLVLAQGFRLTAAGVILGLAIGYGLTRVLATLLFGVKANDPVTFTVVGVTLTLVALAATYLPARRAAGVDPVEALRCQ